MYSSISDPISMSIRSKLYDGETKTFIAGHRCKQPTKKSLRRLFGINRWISTEPQSPEPLSIPARLRSTNMLCYGITLFSNISFCFERNIKKLMSLWFVIIFFCFMNELNKFCKNIPGLCVRLPKMHWSVLLAHFFVYKCSHVHVRGFIFLVCKLWIGAARRRARVVISRATDSISQQRPYLSNSERICLHHNGP